MGEGRTVGRERGGKERRGEVEDRERKKRREKRGAEGAQEREREGHVSKQRLHSERHPPGPGQPCRAVISTVSVHWAEQGRAARRAPPAAPGGPGQLAALGTWPAPRAAQLPRAREPRPTFLHARQLGLIHTHVGHGGRSASGARRPRRTPTPRAGRVDAELPRAGNAPESSTEGERRQKGGGGGGGGGRRGLQAAPHAKAREPDRLPSLWCRPRPAPAAALRPESPDRRLHLPARRRDRACLSSTLGFKTSVKCLLSAKQDLLYLGLVGMYTHTYKHT